MARKGAIIIYIIFLIHIFSHLLMFSFCGHFTSIQFYIDSVILLLYRNELGYDH